MSAHLPIKSSQDSEGRLLIATALILCLATSSSEAQLIPEPVSCGDRCRISADISHVQVALRPAPLDGNVERWYSFTTGFPQQIMLEENRCTAFSLPLRRPLLVDPSGRISYHNAAWSADGRYLAYVQTDATSSIYIQEFQLSLDIDEAIVKVGAPRLVVAGGPGVFNTQPAWRPYGLELAFVSNAASRIEDIYTIAVDPGAPPPAPLPLPIRRTFIDNIVVAPAYSPDGRRLAFSANFSGGSNVIAMLDLGTGQVTLAASRATVSVILT